MGIKEESEEVNDEEDGAGPEDFELEVAIIIVRRKFREATSTEKIMRLHLQSRTKLAKTKHHFIIDQGHHSYGF